jgi:hypothetical protein
MTEAKRESLEGVSNVELKNSIEEAAEKVKKLSEDLRHRISSLQTEASDKALGLLQSVETISEKLHIKTDAEEKAFELLTSLEGLSERLQGYAENFESKLTESQLQFHLGLMEATAKWEQLKEQASGVLGSLHLDGLSPQTLLDEVKVRANLGRMEASELIHKSREEVSRAWQNVSQQSMMAVKGMNQSLGEIIHRFV